jgi:hypothetical protein
VSIDFCHFTRVSDSQYSLFSTNISASDFVALKERIACNASFSVTIGKSFAKSFIACSVFFIFYAYRQNLPLAGNSPQGVSLHRQNSTPLSGNEIRALEL